ncbi:metallopeptidase family protein [Tsukamurella sp. 8F]|uniref:metallopeptidase family protein n=1 Tax=unclassified Tsukamurella TaxID=2633480 RepID=UPI0023B9BA91|nr:MULTISPECIES: metallopeptidase family protein [unclassified Tsukamurella]MDF0530811.1 metallopeptidase family protein [Tsukamurella sp. 8J]MDF0588337.1 metallopeptidase family protein [Tsukamurella sp. 8F]
MFRVSATQFEDWVGDALDDVPEELLSAMSNVVILVRDRNAEDPTLLGLYEGVDLTRRTTEYSALPDRITIYREPLMALASSETQLREEIRVTVLHEVGHHFGIDDHRLHELGWG